MFVVTAYLAFCQAICGLESCDQRLEKGDHERLDKGLLHIEQYNITYITELQKYFSIQIYLGWIHLFKSNHSTLIGV